MKKTKLGSILKIKHGFAFKSEHYVDKSQYALVTLANISGNNNFQFNHDKTTFYGSDFPKEFELKTGDLIMPLTEQVVGLLGNSAFVPPKDNVQFVLNQRVGKVIPFEDIADKYYLHYLLSTDMVREQLEYRASGTRQRNISPNDVYDVTVYIPKLKQQHAIGTALYALENKVNINRRINDNLRQQLKLMYDYWFTQFDFPNEEGKPYRTSGGAMEFSEILKRDIPKDWQIASIAQNPISEIIQTGVDVFERKIYLATADVNETDIGVGNIVDYDTRESRANMQPSYNSVWFAKMKNSVKHLYLNHQMEPLISKAILSTGFCGLQCSEQSFEYIASVIDYSYFETVKDILAHGATQEAVNNDDLDNIMIVIPSERVIDAYHNCTKATYAQISKNICENQELTKLRDWLLPMLMNGQASVVD